MGIRVSLAACALGALGLAMVVANCSPYGGGAFQCSTDPECGAGGTCADGYCAFPDPMCMSGLRYGDLSGPSSGECVGDSTGSDAGMRDAPDDTPIASDTSNCYGTGLVQACFTNVPTGDVTISADVDTDSSGMCQSVVGSPPYCVIAGATISVPGAVNVTGSKPLVLVATGTITIAGTLDASSKRGGQVGAAANGSPCNAGTAPTGNNAGGAGGSFGGAGGSGGGTGNGTPGAAVVPTTLRGGCAGQNGGGGTGGTKGNGGGAVWLIANTSITVQGQINASGAGAGAGGAGQAGGGGAGAGGMIGFDSPTVSVLGAAFANGGGGGEGGTSGGNSGDVGDDPIAATIAAAGGATSTSGGDGGNGAAGTTLTGGNGASGTASGGGGGGGAGIIKLHRTTSISGSGAVSPPPS